MFPQPLRKCFVVYASLPASSTNLYLYPHRHSRLFVSFYVGTRGSYRTKDSNVFRRGFPTAMFQCTSQQLFQQENNPTNYDPPITNFSCFFPEPEILARVFNAMNMVYKRDRWTKLVKDFSKVWFFEWRRRSRGRREIFERTRARKPFDASSEFSSGGRKWINNERTMVVNGMRFLGQCRGWEVRWTFNARILGMSWLMESWAGLVFEWDNAAWHPVLDCCTLYFLFFSSPEVAQEQNTLSKSARAPV